MDHRNWPWRKKSIDKNVMVSDGSDISPDHLSKVFEEQAICDAQMLPVEKAIPGATTYNSSLSHDPTSSLSAEEQVRILNEKLLGALSEITSKDLVVKQHVKVAEEAVSGWEKAEAEASSFKHKFELSQQEKLALEDQISHLDGALKECMRRLRFVQEEQEEAIHEALIKKTRDSEKLRLEFEARLSGMSQQLIQSMAEKSAFGKALQERSKTVSELGDAKSRAESEVQVLQVHLDILEKEKSGLKYELHVSNKEIHIRNEEREYTRKAAEAARKQHLEDVKKITKLETECQRLRALVKKKLPGPAALNQMRLEVEALGKVDRRRKSAGKAGVPSKNRSLDSLEEGSQTGSNDSELLWEKLVAMEEETKTLKDALESKTNELEEAQLICAKTTSKLSNLEQQLDALSHANGVPLAASIAHLEPISEKKKSRSSLASVSGESCNGTEVNCADAWASGLIAELENLKKDKFKDTPDKSLGSANLELMDDFIEMERLASTMSPAKPVTQALDSVDMHLRVNFANVHVDTELSVITQTLATRESELQAANQLTSELTNKLSISEEKLSVLRSKNSANDRAMLHSKEEIKNPVINLVEDTDVDHIFKERRVAARNDVAEIQSPEEQISSELVLLGEGSSRSSRLQLQPPCASSEESGSEADASSSISKCDRKAKLEVSVCRLIHLVELIAHQMGFEHTALAEEENRKLLGLTTMQDCKTLERDVPGMKWSNPILESYVCKLVVTGKNVLQGKIDSIDFIAELSSVIVCILDLELSRSAEGMTNFSLVKNLTQSAEGLLEPTRSQVVPLASISSDDLKVEDIGEETKNVLIPDASGAYNSGFYRSDKEFYVPHSDKEKNDSETMSALSRVSMLQDDLAKLKIEKEELEEKLEKANEGIECLKIQVSNAEHLISNLRVQLASTQESKQLAEDKLETVACTKSELESQVKIAVAEVNQLQERVAALTVELEEERKNHQDVMARLKHLQQQLSEGVSVNEIVAQFSLEGNGKLPWCNNEEARLQKEREIVEAAEKLAQCQRTILALGKQLKALALPTLVDSVDPMDSAEGNASLEHIYSSNKDLKAVEDTFQGETQESLAHQKDQQPSQRPPKDLGREPVQRSGKVQVTKDTDRYRSNRSVYSNSDHGRSIQMLSTNLPRSSLPGRSPVKFRPSKSRILNATAELSKSLNAADSPPSEKLSNSGFARFFSRTRSSHG